MRLLCYVEIPVVVEVHPTKNLQGEYEMITMCGKHIRGMQLAPDEPPEIGDIMVHPTEDYDNFDDQIKIAVDEQISDEEMWKLIKEQEEDTL